MSTADRLDELSEEQGIEAAYREAIHRLGVLGFNPHTDAIDQRAQTATVHYFHDGEIWWARKEAWGRDVWLSPSPIHTAGDLYERLTAASDYRVIDKRVFNWLISGPLAEVDGVHGGLCWGIVRLFERDIKNGNDLRYRQLKCIGGIGDKLGKRIARKLHEYPTFPESVASVSP